MSARRRCWKISVGGTAAIFLAAQLTSIAHLCFVRHVVCAEHGEAIDVAPSSSVTVERTSIAAVASDSSPDDHCQLEAFRRQGSRPADATAAVVVAVAWTTTTVRFDKYTPAPAIDLLLLAPKGSPPRS